MLENMDYQPTKWTLQGKLIIQKTPNSFLNSLIFFTKARGLFELPKKSRLQVIVRSNRTGEALTDDYIMEDMIIMMLAACCDWYKLLTRVQRTWKYLIGHLIIL
jgi:hypothetical protein